MNLAGSPSLRRAAHKTYKVMFTGYEDEKECKIVKDLGITLYLFYYLLLVVPLASWGMPLTM